MRLPNFPNQVEFDNEWVVPYSPLLSKTYKAHINVELCSSVKSIKYICNYVNKGSDLAIFEVQNINKNDEIARYQMGRYISSNEAIWHILSFPIHEKEILLSNIWQYILKTVNVYTSLKKMFSKERSKLRKRL
ncbi:uncharacterized protein TNCV_1561891 [Trichonephila clavipes]|nr:uncharacterized protein TNCV_1561891 [Trichonephila clavipes]